MLRWNYSSNLNNLIKDIIDKKALYAKRKVPFALKEVKFSYDER